MEEKLLYPIKFCTLQDDYCWGSEVFKIADLGYRDSLVREGWLAGNSLSEVMDTYIEKMNEFREAIAEGDEARVRSLIEEANRIRRIIR